jgi:hypothetical protein
MKRFTWIVKGFAPLAVIYSVMLILDGCFGWGITKAGVAAAFPMVMVGIVVLVPSIYALLATWHLKKPDPDEAARKAIRGRAAEHKAAVHGNGS